MGEVDGRFIVSGGHRFGPYAKILQDCFVSLEGEEHYLHLARRPDGRQVIVYAGREWKMQGMFAGDFIRVQDGQPLLVTRKDQGLYVVHGEQAWGPYDLDIIPYTVHIDDGEPVFVARKGASLHVVHGARTWGPYKQTGKQHPDIIDGEPLFAAEDADGWWIIHGPTRWKGFGPAFRLTIAAGTPLYVAECGREYFVVHGDRRFGPYHINIDDTCPIIGIGRSQLELRLVGGDPCFKLLRYGGEMIVVHGAKSWGPFGILMLSEVRIVDEKPRFKVRMLGGDGYLYHGDSRTGPFPYDQIAL